TAAARRVRSASGVRFRAPLASGRPGRSLFARFGRRFRDGTAAKRCRREARRGLPLAIERLQTPDPPAPESPVGQARGSNPSRKPMRSVSRPWSVAAAGLLLVAGCGKGGTKVVVPPLSAIVLNVVTDTLTVNAPKQYAATALDLSSQPVSGVPFIWSSSDPTVFTVTSSGRVTGHSEGAAKLFVEFGGVRDSADLL